MQVSILWLFTWDANAEWFVNRTRLHKKALVFTKRVLRHSLHLCSYFVASIQPFVREFWRIKSKMLDGNRKYRIHFAKCAKTFECWIHFHLIKWNVVKFWCDSEWCRVTSQLFLFWTEQQHKVEVVGLFVQSYNTAEWTAVSLPLMNLRWQRRIVKIPAELSPQSCLVTLLIPSYSYLRSFLFMWAREKDGDAAKLPHSWHQIQRFVKELRPRRRIVNYFKIAFALTQIYITWVFPQDLKALIPKQAAEI